MEMKMVAGDMIYHTINDKYIIVSKSNVCYVNQMNTSLTGVMCP